MDVERTIKFILDSQAKAEVRMSAADKRVDAVEKRLDKRMDAIAKLLQQGMRMLVTYKADTDRHINALVDAQMRTESKMEQLAEAQKGAEARFERLDAQMAELAAAQKDTQKTLKAFIESLHKGRNGH